jgi:hypothetical protein
MWIVNETEWIEYRKAVKTATVVTRTGGENDLPGDMPSFSRGVEATENNFMVQLVGQVSDAWGTYYTLKLTPRPSFESSYDEIIWVIDGQEWLPVEIKLSNPNEEYTYSLSSIVTDAQIDPGLFARPKWPRDVSVEIR